MPLSPGTTLGPYEITTRILWPSTAWNPLCQ